MRRRCRVVGSGRLWIGPQRVGLLAVLVAAAFCPASIAQAAPTKAATTPEAARTFAVGKSFDNRAFDVRMTPLASKDAFRVYRLTYPSPLVTPYPPNNTIPADYYLPSGMKPGDPPRPAVICLHILEGDFALAHLTCSVLATRGIPALMFKLPYYGERSLPGGRRALADRPDLLIGALSQGLLDVRRTVDVLAALPEIDSRRIGVTGISLGGIVAAAAAGGEPRIARAALVLAGGDLPTIIHHARETRSLSRAINALPPAQRAEIDKIIAGIDPLKQAAGLKGRAAAGRVMMINAADDEVIPKACTQKLAAALGIGDQVVWLPGMGHYTAMAALPDALRQVAAFFAADLPEGTPAPQADAAPSGPAARVAALAGQFATLLAADAKSGRCHIVDLEARVALADGKEHRGRVRYVRGSNHKFTLYADIPGIGEASFGQGAYPWMASTKDAVYVGKLPPGQSVRDPLEKADPRNTMLLRVAAGALTTAAMAPDMLDRFAAIRAGDKATIEITAKDNPRDRVRLHFKDDRKTPDRAEFDIDGVRGEVVVRAWQFDAPAQDELFREPIGKTPQEVDAADLYGMFTALFNFAMENAK